MLIKKILSPVSVSLALAFHIAPLAPANAQNNAPVSYSATALHALPGQRETSGTILKGGQKLRLEFIAQGKNIVQILRPEIGAMYILDPAKETYHEVLGPAVPSTATENYTNPCPGQTESQTCQRIGTDTTNGIAVERWVLSTSPQQQPTVLLWDSTRRRALRQDFPDGRSMVMSFKSMRDLNGRNTEYWTISMTNPNQPATSGDWWFDPQLRVVVRETLPTGETRRLENIAVGPIDPKAFEIPQGWQKIDLPIDQPPNANK